MSAVETGWHVDGTREGYVDRLRSACMVRDTANRQIELLVGKARGDGIPWQVIADGLNRSVQATWNRFRHLDEQVKA